MCIYMNIYRNFKYSRVGNSSLVHKHTIIKWRKYYTVM